MNIKKTDIEKHNLVSEIDSVDIGFCFKTKAIF